MYVVSLHLLYKKYVLCSFTSNYWCLLKAGIHLFYVAIYTCTRLFKIENLKNWVGIDHCYKRWGNNYGIIFWQDIFKNLIPTFGKHSLIMLTHCNRPRVGIKLLKISCQNIIPCFLTFCSSDTQFFLNFQFINILVCLLFILHLYKYIT